MADLKHEIEIRYAEICSRVDAAAGSDNEDDALREAFAELAAMMIAYRYQEGAREALEAALSHDRDRNAGRLSLAARARAFIAESR